MAEEKKTEKKEDEVKPGEKFSTDSYNYKRDHVKSLRQIALESQARLKKDLEGKEEDPVKEEKPEEKKETPATPSAEELAAKQKADDEAAAKKAAEDSEAKQRAIAEEAAKKVAEETKAAFKEEISKILDKDKTIDEKQKDADSLIAVWKKENRLPKDYEELITETMRIADAKMEQREKEREAARQADAAVKAKKEEEEKALTEESAKKAQQEGLDEFNRDTAVDLDDLYIGKFLTKPTKPEEVNNPNTTDAGAKETQEIFKFWADLNIERGKKQLPPIVSLNKVYFMHYKPYRDAQNKTKSKEVPGANAPVAGGTNAASTDNSKKAYVYARDHGKTFAQLAVEAKQRMRNGL